jgi:lipoprotein signal peptidase
MSNWLTLVADSTHLTPARSQMAFTLGFHIILVPLGVSWACMALVANYRGIKKGDADALLLAQRWSKCMAVTFAVGAVTGTVLTFEFGLLWPKFMGQYGAAFGIPFAVEGLFFLTEAIFIAIYIYGWRRLKPWAHFWTGVPVVIAGIGGTISVALLSPNAVDHGRIPSSAAVYTMILIAVRVGRNCGGGGGPGWPANSILARSARPWLAPTRSWSRWAGRIASRLSPPARALPPPSRPLS